MTSPTGTAPDARGFTLVELILVMGLLATVLAVSAPSLARTVQSRSVTTEAGRWIELIEQARTEAVSRGVPYRVWADPSLGLGGLEPEPGFPVARPVVRDHRLPDAIRIGRIEGIAGTGGRTVVATFGPDGFPAPDAMAALTLIGPREASATVARTEDAWGYEILDAERHARRDYARILAEAELR